MTFVVLYTLTFLFLVKRVWYSSKKRVFDAGIVFSIFFGLTFLYRPFLILMDIGRIRMPPGNNAAYNEDNVIWAMSIGMIFYVIAITVYLYSVNSRIERPKGILFPSFSNQLNEPRTRFFILLLAGISFYRYMILLSQESSFGSLILNLRQGVYNAEYLVTLLPQVLAMIASLLIVNRDKKRSLMFLDTGIFLGLLILVALTGDRSGVIVPLVFFMMMRYLGVKKIKFFNLIIGMIVLVYLLNFLAEVRSNITFGTSGPEGSQGVAKEVAIGISKGLNLQTFDYFLIITEWLTFNNMRLGIDYYHGAIGWVPRVIWSGKPEVIHEGIWLSKEFYGSDNAGRPFTNTGVWFVNFGIFGVLIGGWLSGLLLGAVSRYLRNVQSFPELFYYCLLAVVVVSKGWSAALPILFVKFLLPIRMLLTVLTKRIK